jgi:hypothetical protein
MALHVPMLIVSAIQWRKQDPARVRGALIAAAALCIVTSVLLLIFVLILLPPVALGVWFLVSLAGPPVVFGLEFDKPKPPPGRCIKCDYSLKGLTTTTCPECGTIQPTDTAAHDAAPHRGPDAH